MSEVDDLKTNAGNCSIETHAHLQALLDDAQEEWDYHCGRADRLALSEMKLERELRQAEARYEALKAGPQALVAWQDDVKACAECVLGAWCTKHEGELFHIIEVTCALIEQVEKGE